jgi:hypothetical protein
MATKKNTTDFYAQWLENQKALMQTWREMATKSVESLAEGNFTGAMNAAREGYETAWRVQQETAQEIGKTLTGQIGEWVQNAQSIPFFPNFITANDNSASAGASASDAAAMAQYWLSLQSSMMKPWAQFFPQPPFNMMTEWTRLSEMAASSFGLLGQVAKMYEHWQHFSQSWSGATQKMYASFADSLPAGVAQDALRNMFSSANAYMKLFEFWAPAIEALKSGKKITAEDMQAMMNPAKYKEIMDAVFEFITPNAMQSLYSQMTAFAQSLHVSANQATRTLMAQMEQNAKVIFGMMAHNPETALKLYNTLSSAYQQALSSMNALPMNQRQSEMAEIARQILERFSEYYSHITKFQHILYTNGQKALEQISERFFTATRNKKTLTNFDELFGAWVETNEAVFAELFETSQYAQAQSALAHVSSLLHKDFERLFEVMLKDFPVVTRSQVDDLAKTVFELKRTVRALEKSDEANDDDETPAAAKTASKKAATRK